MHVPTEATLHCQRRCEPRADSVQLEDWDTGETVRLDLDPAKTAVSYMCILVLPGVARHNSDVLWTCPQISLEIQGVRDLKFSCRACCAQHPQVQNAERLYQRAGKQRRAVERVRPLLEAAEAEVGSTYSATWLAPLQRAKQPLLDVALLKVDLPTPPSTLAPCNTFIAIAKRFWGFLQLTYLAEVELSLEQLDVPCGSGDMDTLHGIRVCRIFRHSTDLAPAWQMLKLTLDFGLRIVPACSLQLSQVAQDACSTELQATLEADQSAFLLADC